jgi:hypothetical protein
MNDRTTERTGGRSVLVVDSQVNEKKKRRRDELCARLFSPLDRVTLIMLNIRVFPSEVSKLKS